MVRKPTTLRANSGGGGPARGIELPRGTLGVSMYAAEVEEVRAAAAVDAAEGHGNPAPAVESRASDAASGAALRQRNAPTRATGAGGAVR